jgi:hypothetical protein
MKFDRLLSRFKKNGEEKAVPETAQPVVQGRGSVQYIADFERQTKAVILKTIIPGIGVVSTNVYPLDFIRTVYFECKKVMDKPDLSIVQNKILKPNGGLVK